MGCCRWALFAFLGTFTQMLQPTLQAILQEIQAQARHGGSGKERGQHARAALLVHQDDPWGVWYNSSSPPFLPPHGIGLFPGAPGAAFAQGLCWRMPQASSRCIYTGSSGRARGTLPPRETLPSPRRQSELGHTQITTRSTLKAHALKQRCRTESGCKQLGHRQHQAEPGQKSHRRAALGPRKSQLRS